MILPKKQLSIEESLWGFGGFLLKQLQKPMLVDELWECYKEFYSNGKYLLILFGYISHMKHAVVDISNPAMFIGDVS